MVINGWNRPVLGHEHDLRRFASSFRALPAVEPVPLKTSCENPKIFAGRFGNRIGIINDTDMPQTITVRLDKPLPVKNQLIDVSTGKILMGTDCKDRDAFTISAVGYDIHTLIID